MTAPAEPPSFANRGVPIWMFLVVAILSGSGGSIATSAGEVSWTKLEPTTIAIFVGVLLIVSAVAAVCWGLYRLGGEALKLADRVLADREKERVARLDAYAARVSGVSDMLVSTSSRIDSLGASIARIAQQAERTSEQIAKVAGALESEARRAVAMAVVTRHGVQHVLVNSMNIAQMNETLAELARAADLNPPALNPTPPPPDVSTLLQKPVAAGVES